MSDEETTTEQLAALLTSFSAEVRRDMSQLRQDVFKLRDDQLQTRALVDEIRRKLRETDRRLGMLSAKVDDLTEKRDVREGQHSVFREQTISAALSGYA